MKELTKEQAQRNNKAVFITYMVFWGSLFILLLGLMFFAGTDLGWWKVEDDLYIIFLIGGGFLTIVSLIAVAAVSFRSNGYGPIKGVVVGSVLISFTALTLIFGLILILAIGKQDNENSPLLNAGIFGGIASAFFAIMSNIVFFIFFMVTRNKNKKSKGKNN